MGLSDVVSLISLSGCSRFALSSVCLGSLVVLGLSPLVVPLLFSSLLQQLLSTHNSHLVLCVIRGRENLEWSKTWKVFCGI